MAMIPYSCCYSHKVHTCKLESIPAARDLAVEMKLINTTTGELREFVGSEIPEYGILSHRWASEQDEISYKDYRKGWKIDTPAYDKIRNFCDLVRSHGLDWAWIDTCCIEKRSSAELSEAINSMFGWYRRASICFVYLNDVGPDHLWQGSKWWLRGWTLQELIAPADVRFYDQHWRLIGSKLKWSIEIAALTGLPQEVLLYSKERMYKHFTVAEKMRWAARRQTTRVEDKAYCLLGIFHIHMPLLYGEGPRAFQRLQLEILQKYSDETIFGWTPRTVEPHLVLAEDPSYFEDITCAAPQRQIAEHEREHPRVRPPRATSWGIEIRVNARQLWPLKETHLPQERLFWAVGLTSAWGGRIRQVPRTIVLVHSGPHPNSYKRLDCLELNGADSLHELCKTYHVGDVEEGMIFYLQFDSDFDYF